MNYIGSKKKLLPFLQNSILSHWKEKPGVFCDLFAGTGVVGAHWKSLGWRVQANDRQYYSYVLLRQLIGNSKTPRFLDLVELKSLSGKNRAQEALSLLQNLPGKKGYIYKNLCPGGSIGGGYSRQYFSDENGMLCDAAREQIEAWKKAEKITEDEYYYLLASLLEGIDSVANTASVYGAFLKHIKASARKPLCFLPPECIPSSRKNSVYNKDGVQLLGEISGDILYLDPPYNQRQYAANYHVLETIARGDKPKAKGKTGLRNWQEQKSAWCSKETALLALREVLDKARYPLVALSYNDEGLLPMEEIAREFRSRGKYTLHKKRYSRFRADKASARNHRRDEVVEHLHILQR